MTRKRHYQDAYEMLIIMFGSTAILPPRTKRWAEAKVLADCINIKVRYLALSLLGSHGFDADSQALFV